MTTAEKLLQKARIKPEEITKMEKDWKRRKVNTFIDRFENQKQFSVGDIVVCTDKEGKIKPNLGDGRYIVIHKDTNELITCRSIRSDGSMGSIWCPLADNNTNFYLSLDPELAVNILLQNEGAYDPTAAGKDLKRRKDRCRKMNKENIIEWPDRYKDEPAAIKAGEEFIASLKIGDVFYDPGSLCDPAAGYSTMTVKDIKTEDLTQYLGKQHWYVPYHLQEAVKAGKNSQTTVTFHSVYTYNGTSNNNGYDRQYGPYDITAIKLMNKKPVFLEDV